MCLLPRGPWFIEGSLIVAQRPHQTAIRVDLAAVEGP